MTSPGDRRSGIRRHMKKAQIAVAALLAVGLGVTLVGDDSTTAPAGATSIAHPTLVRGTPASNTAHVTDGDVYSVAVVGSSVVLAGNFTGAQDPDRSPVDRSFLLAFDRNTGIIRRNWAPQLDREAYSVTAAPDGQSVYVGGRFNSVNGETRNKIARISMADGTNLPFQHGVDGVVNTMALQGDRLYIGGTFKNVQGRARRVAALNPNTGAIDDNMAVPFEGTHRGGDGKIWRIEPSPDGQSLVVVGSFATVGGQPRNQVAKLDINGTGPVSLSAWSTTAFSGFCASFSDYVRDVSFSPDSSYFVVVSTGAKGSGIGGTCDSVTRWENNTTPGSWWSWVEYSGGDTYYSVEVTGAAIYVGGHFRWSNNSFGTDSLGAGGIATTGLASLDPRNGLPMSWNPGRDRGRAVWQLVATPDGLWVASDTDRIAGGIYRGRIAFFPLAGGQPVPQPQRTALPASVEQLVPAQGGNLAKVTGRNFDGTTMAAPAPLVADASALSGVTASFWAEGILYTTHNDGQMRARSFDGTTFGPATTVDLLRLTSFASDMANMGGAMLDNGRLYYTINGSSALYMRYFSVESRVIGAERFTVATSSGSLAYQSITGMVALGDHVYYVDAPSGQLRRTTLLPNGALNPSGITTVSNANADGQAWSGAELWARPGVAPNLPPVAAATASCSGLRCTFDASGSSDPDGSIAGVTWVFNDGGNATGTTATHTFSAPGNYVATVTVTDDDGASAITTRNVTVNDADPRARLTATCEADTCSVNGSTSDDLDGEIVSHAWAFGDGATADGATASHRYEESGTYTITLTVTDNRGRTGTATRSVSVVVPAIQPEFVGASNLAGTTAVNHRVAAPAAVRAGDQLLLFASTNGPAAHVINTPAGWTRILDPATSGSRHAVFARTAVAADAGAEVTVSLGSMARTHLVLAAYRGVTVAPGAAFTSGYRTPTVTAAAGDWLVSYWSDKSATTANIAPPTGATVRHQAAGTGAGHMAEALADSGAAVPSGPAGNLQATVAAPVSNAVAVSMLLRPIPG